MSADAETTTQTDSALRRRTMRKVAWRLSPFLGLLYFINYLDRVNIGFAAPHGMNEALGFTASTFGLASGLFFVGYLILEEPRQPQVEYLQPTPVRQKQTSGWRSSNCSTASNHGDPSMVTLAPNRPYPRLGQ